MKRLAVAFIHGMGSQGVRAPVNSAEATYSKALQKLLKGELGDARFGQIAFREIFWADILQERQEEYLKKIRRRTRFHDMRTFVLCNLSDAAAYRKNHDANDDTYNRVHESIARVIAELEADCEPGAPLVILAHSLGGHMMSDHIYDMTKQGAAPPTRFQGFRTLAGFITFGCNIPIFTFSYAPDKIVPIRFPGTDLPPEKQFRPWWLNFYDKDDVLGYPLRDIGKHYKAMVDGGEIHETAINAGSLLSSWNPLSHNAYWRDEEFYKPVARYLKRLL